MTKTSLNYTINVLFFCMMHPKFSILKNHTLNFKTTVVIMLMVWVTWSASLKCKHLYLYSYFRIPCLESLPSWNIHCQLHVKAFPTTKSTGLPTMTPLRFISCYRVVACSENSSTSQPNKQSTVSKKLFHLNFHEKMGNPFWAFSLLEQN